MAHRAGQPIMVGIGEVLWDLLPGGKQLGGAPANFAYHAHALGAEAWPVSRVGKDALGRGILERLQALGLPTGLVSVDSVAPTGTVSVELSTNGQPHFTIHENVAWDRLVATEEARKVVAQADAVCFGSLAQRSEISRSAIQALLDAAPRQALRVFDINLRQHFYSLEIIETSLRLANALKINDQEWPVLAEMLELPCNPAGGLAELASRYKLRLIALTRGAQGSLLYSDGRFSDHSGCKVKVVDSVGAGDAFTAAMALGVLASRSIEEVNDAANKVAAYVCSQCGATPPVPQELRSLFASQGDKQQG